MWDFIIASSLHPYYSKLMCYTDVSKTFPLVWKLWPKSIKYFTEPQWSSFRENVCESPGNYGASDFLQKPFNCLDCGQLGAPTYIDLFACSSASVECWPCGRVVPSSTDIVQSDIVSPMKWDMTTYHLPSPLPRGHTTPHTAQPGTLWEIQINSENVMVILLLLSHSYPLTLTWIDDWSENSPCSVSGAPTSLPGHPTPRLPCGRKGTHQFHCF